MCLSNLPSHSQSFGLVVPFAFQGLCQPSLRPVVRLLFSALPSKAYLLSPIFGVEDVKP